MDGAGNRSAITFRSARKTIVVVGNGMVGHRFCEQLAALDATQSYDVIVFGEERRAAYDRVQLRGYFESRNAEDLSIASRDWYAEQGFTLHLGDPIVEIDRDASR